MVYAAAEAFIGGGLSNTLLMVIALGSGAGITT